MREQAHKQHRNEVPTDTDDTQSPRVQFEKSLVGLSCQEQREKMKPPPPVGFDVQTKSEKAPATGAVIQFAALQEPIDDRDTIYKPAELDKSKKAEPTHAPKGERFDAVVRIKHDQHEPLRTRSQPSGDDLYEVIATDVSEDTEVSAGHRVTDRVRLDMPLTEEADLDRSTIYIDDTPTADDVRQGGIGDCYLMAALVSIAESDPKAITRCLQLKDDYVIANVYYWDTQAPPEKREFKAATLETSLDLAYSRENNELVGAGLKTADDPIQQWWGDIYNTSLDIYRQYVFQAALWVPLFEKIYAIYCEMFGQYGGQKHELGGDAENAPKDSGYETMEGGSSRFIYGILYGNDMIARRPQEISYTAGDEGDVNLTENLWVIELLMGVQGGKGKGKKGETETFLTAAAKDLLIYQRTVDQIDAMIGNNDIEGHPSMSKDLAYLKTLLSGYLEWWEGVDSDVISQEDLDELDKEKMLKISQVAQRIVTPEAYPAMHSPKAEQRYKELCELLNIVMNAGVFSNAQQRMIFSHHAYSVTGATFVDKKGQAFTLEPNTVKRQLLDIDINTSKVEIVNPHHTNEPDPNSRGLPAQEDDDGRFLLTLDQFIRCFTQMDEATVVRRG